MIAQTRDHARRTPDTDRIGVGSGWSHRRAALVLIAGLVLVTLIVVRIGSEPRGLSSAEEVGTAYVAAARSQDRAALQRLTPADFEARAAIEEKIQLYRGLGARPVSVRYLPPDVTPNVVATIVEADGLRDQIAIQRFGSRWYLMIGQLQNQHPGPPTAQPRN